MIKQVPGILSFVQKLKDLHYAFKCKYLYSTEKVFKTIYQDKLWGAEEESVSGPGSSAFATAKLSAALPTLFERYGIRSILDIPCGDFNWMQSVHIAEIDYIGADIVPELIQNNAQYAGDRVAFRVLNLMKDRLPSVDLIFCRDCLLHFSFKDIFTALHNICSTKATYFLVSSYSEQTLNKDIITGQGRFLNLQAAPFHFPEPLEMIHEGEGDSKLSSHDKSMMLFKISDIKDVLKYRE